VKRQTKKSAKQER